MPTYTFRNKTTDVIEEHKMSYTVLDKFKADHPNLERYFALEDLPVMSDAMRLSVPGTQKCDPTFEKYVIQRMADTIPGNTLKKNHKTKRPTEW